MRTKRVKTAIAGFTLIELLAVIGIIAILAALLFPVVGKAKRQTKRVMANAEVLQIQQALAAYARDMRGGPKGNFDGFSPTQRGDSLEVDPVPITRDLAKILMGENINGNNPTFRHYMEFKRFDKKGIPVTPWWKPELKDPETEEHYRYFAKLDSNFDQQISAGLGGEPDNPPKQIIKSPVIVWAHNMDEPETALTFIIRSWDL